MKPPHRYSGANAAGGLRHWRSLDELSDTPEFRQWLEREFPENASDWLDAERDGLGRRRFLSLMGASLALAGFAGCSLRSREKIVPYVAQPEEIVPGRPLYYATAMPLRGYGRGIIVETQMGRPVKIEGNPAHPDSLGATDAVMQAAVLELWNPDRSQTPMFQGGISDWGQFESELLAVMAKMSAADGEGMAILTEASTSPTLQRQRAAWLAKFPKARWYWGGGGSPIPKLPPAGADFGKADLIVSIGCDIFADQPGSLRFTRQFAKRRRVENGRVNPNRLYVLESTPTITGSMADHRLAAPPDRIAAVLRWANGRGDEVLDPAEQTFARNLAADLAAHRANSIVIAGETEPDQIRSLAESMGAGKNSQSLPEDELATLCGDLAGGHVQNLFILGGNPAYNSPAALGFADHLRKATFTVHLGHYYDETSRQCRWHLPQTHFLEEWSDILASGGTPTIIQPVIDPLYAGKSIHEVLSLLTGTFRPSGYDIVRATWGASGKGDFGTFWDQSVHDGIVAGAPPAAAPGARAAGDAVATPAPSGAPAIPPPALTPGADYLLIRPDPAVGDGRWADNGWLQEMPKPMTKLTWDNAAILSPAMARRHGLGTGDMIDLHAGGRSVRAPVMVLPGQADRCVTVHLGYGRTVAGKVGSNRGFSAYPLQDAHSPWCLAGLEIRKAEGTYELATTQHHFSMEGRDIVRVAGVDEFRANPEFAAPKLPHPPSLLPAAPPLHHHATYAWGLTVDLSTCTGCAACVIACQAENNIPYVGKEQVAAGREMHWIRIDRYFEGAPENPAMLNQPVLCMHCENAPCEVVCPVAATVHNDEGLNTMIYNRCVGTRYCSNNCPYKVRRFNFLEYSPPPDSAEAQGENPNVTVRRRGVMEKCTYCVQRINLSRIAAELDNRRIRDGEIQTACQQACPAEAIVFGNLLDPGSRVSRRKKEPVNYGLLTELNTRPRTTYLARIRNPFSTKESA
ncbi:MAG TPA: TAT-variant-translocated molybdopterin oxidoreductase [Chthoniobacteraceae bacterium]|jgi:molybdopterin-containing oxidoreductase family iron-sulfur binding subunit|nr:TAT-variant-translocated molybdopterin oxidoreductase [Chthoniobacteraceae bacterium]